MSFVKHLLWSVVVSLALAGTGCGDDGGDTPDAAQQQPADAAAEADAASPPDAPAGGEADAAGGDQADASGLPTADVD